MFARLMENGRFLIYIAVVSSFVASVITFLWGALRLAQNIGIFAQGVAGRQIEDAVGINMIAVVDAFLLGTILYIFAVGLYELFIGDLDVPDWLEIHSLDDLKGKLLSVIIMIMAVLFLEHLAEWTDPLPTLAFGGAIAIVTFALVFYSGAMKSAEKAKQDRGSMAPAMFTKGKTSKSAEKADGVPAELGDDGL